MSGEARPIKAAVNTSTVFPLCAPEDQGMIGSALDNFRDRLGRDKINSCLLIRNGHCVFEYFRHNKIASKPQKIHSVTKSIVSALVGICLDKGLLPSRDTPILDFFPTMAQREHDTRKRSITVDHLLTMTPGYDWPEFAEWNFFCHMFFAPHWVRFVLERPLACDPGERMNYNTGATHLLAAIVQQVSGMKAAAFADQHLFGPLGFTDYRWREDPQGVNDGGSGLALSVLDMAKFGYLYLREGRWGSRQILSQDWVAASTVPRYMTYEHIGHYARHWWVGAIDPARPLTDDNRFHFALGHMGQFIIIVPSADLVAVFTSELDQSLLPLRLFRDHVLPAAGILAAVKTAT